MLDISRFPLDREQASDVLTHRSIDPKAVDGGFSIVVLLRDVSPSVQQILHNRIVTKEHRCVQRGVSIGVANARVASLLDQNTDALQIPLDRCPAQNGRLKLRV